MILPHDINFIRENNKIEGIKRSPTMAEKEEFARFMAQDSIALSDLIKFVSVYQPDARLRDRQGLNVRVGNYYPPKGGAIIKAQLFDIIDQANIGENNASAAYRVHQLYEKLHPFTDGNGRSGRMIWMWMMKYAPLGFLHTWYYQSLNGHRDETA